MGLLQRMRHRRRQDAQTSRIGNGDGTATAPVLSLEHVRVAYGPIVALRDVSIRVGDQEIVAVLGANGAGKSSLLAAAVGLVAPSAGSVVLRGQDITGDPPEKVARLGVSLVPERRELFSGLSVAENLELGSTVQKDAASVRASYQRVYELFPILKERAKQPAALLSGGEQQQLAIARALMSAPTLILLDEPSLGLAPQLVDTVMSVVAEIRAAGVSVVIVEQFAERALDISDRAYVLAGGRIILSGDSTDLASNMGAIEKAYLGVEEKSAAGSPGHGDQ